MAKKVKKKELGMGIRALLANAETAPEQQREVVRELSHTVAMIPIAQIEVNPFQPRKEFDEEALQELAHSIKVHGLIQPITVRRLAEKSYQLISGERRLRAARLAGLDEVPAYIRLANDQEMLEMALVENIQREDLNAIEVAITFQRLIDECHLTHEALSERVGKKRSTVSNFLRLLRLPPEIQKAVKERHISMGHARALAGIEDLALQLVVFRKVIEGGLSVRATEALIRRYASARDEVAKKKATSELPEAYQRVQDQLSRALGTRVQLKRNAQGKGQIVIPFTNDEDLNRILELLDR